MKGFPRVLPGLRALLIIAVVTILVWLLAESESLRVDKVPARVAFRAEPESGRTILVDPAQDFTGNISLRLEGSAAAVDALAPILRKEIRLVPGAEGIPITPGRHTINLLTVLSAMPVIRDSGVSIAEIEPETVTVVVDDLLSRDVPVHVELPEGQALDGPPELSQTTATLRYPKALTAAVPDELQLVARIDPARLAGLPEGRRTTLTGIPIELPEGVRHHAAARITPPQVNVSLTLRSRSTSATIPAVQVHIRLAPTETLGRWDIQIPPESRTITNVTVTGPTDLIEQIREEKLRIIATVDLSFDELERAADAGTPLNKDVSFSDLPSPLRFEARQKSIRLTVQRHQRPQSSQSPATDPTPDNDN